MNSQKQKKRFIAFSGTGMRQAAKHVALDDDAIDTRHNCKFTIDDVVTSETVYDCADQDIHDEDTESQMKN